VVSGPSPVGELPVWSPTADTIAFVQQTGPEDDQGPLFVMAPDGTGQRQIGSATYSPGIDWSPDGTWIVAQSIPEFQIMIINVKTGLRLPLAFISGGEVAPTWKP
jgi:Tol biopolymer transport system component